MTQKTLPTNILAIIYPEAQKANSLLADIPLGLKIDQAHVLMLKKQGLIDEKTSRALLNKISSIIDGGYQDIQGLSFERGWYISYENYLIEKLGMDVAGYLQTGRSRNDYFATIFRLYNRQQLQTIVPLYLKIQQQLLAFAKKHTETPAIIHTQMQPASFGTYGHHFAGFASSLNIHITAFLKVFSDNEYSPLGAGAAAGTSLPIDTQYTAELLGFEGALDNSLQSVAHYEYIMPMAGALAGANLVLERLATTLHLWATQEFSYISFSGPLYGASSMLPQKRNPFILEVIKERIAANISLMTSMQSGFLKVPFSNAMETKAAARKFWQMLDGIQDILILTEFMLSHLEVTEENHASKDIYKGCYALFLAEKEVKEEGTPFRQAYKNLAEKLEDTTSFNTCKPKDMINAFSYGGGPSPESVKNTLDALTSQHSKALEQWKNQTEIWEEKAQKFQKIVQENI
ncbi:MAG: hypothetical protein H6860_00935 [Rhodospirillales bacterium]|nr:hypothetical protein [Rhodospirillales bacterium]